MEKDEYYLTIKNYFPVKLFESIVLHWRIN